MKLGIIADVIIAVLAIVLIVLATKRGFIRSVLYYTSTILAVVTAILSAGPLSKFFDYKFGWIAAMDNWKVPFLSGRTLLWIFVAISVFVIMRLILMLLDKVLKCVKEKLKVVNVMDRILGFVFGVFITGFILGVIFMLIDAMNLQKFLQLTAEGGSYIAQYLFAFFKENIFSMLSAILNSVTEVIPKV